ncbi:plasmid stabilization protein [Actinocorallia aurantiaca]|uniref:Plasmid stabilization protein n=1 Tax=Actinocorallia aurantiaca TaxID=46204 RepID=A0ABN3U6F9_9ACTN
MPQAWSDKRERQYEHIKQSQKEQGTGEKRAKEVAARTVNKNRAQSGEARRSSRTSREDMSPQRRGGLRSGKPGPRGRTKEQLYEEAKRRDIPGRSNMTKSELEKALSSG